MISAPSGVKISVFNIDSKKNNGLIEVAKDGYLGTVESIELKELKPKKIAGSDDEKLQRWQSLQIEVEVAPGVAVLAFNVDNNKDVTASRDWRAKPEDQDDPALDAPKGAKVYRRFVPVTESELQLVPTTKFPNNNIRLLEALGDGYYQLWRIAIVSQHGEFFLTVEKVREPFRCYRSGISVVCPAHVENEKQKGWPRLLTLLNSVLNGETFQSLPPIKELNDPTKPASIPSSHKNNGITEGEARVAFFADAEGWGMLHTKKGPVRVHWQNVKRPGSRRICLKPGELVSYTELTQPHLTRERGTGFKLEAVGVTLKEENAE